MIKKLAGEVWKPLLFSGWRHLRNRYAVSSAGRIASYKIDVLEDGKLLEGSFTTGYRTLNLHRPGTKSTLYVHREMAKVFLQPPSAKHRFVIHLNHDKLDNNLRNIRWVTQEQMAAHQQKSPARIAYKKKQSGLSVGQKLNAGQVRKIKTELKRANRTLTIRQMASKYRVSEMTLYRIKSGENWANIK